MRAFALPLIALAALVTGAAAFEYSSCDMYYARTTPPPGSTVVDGSGKYEGSFLTVSEGVAQLNPKTTKEQTIFIQPGVYHEQVLISPLQGPLILQGYTCDPILYSENTVTITHALAQRDLPPEVTKGRNDLTSTMRFKSKKGVKVFNLNIANTAGDVGQAVAAYVGASDYGFYACNFTGYQDTLYASKGRQLFLRSYISGAVDFVFGAYARAWFDLCDFEVVGKGSITAHGRNSDTNPSWFIFSHATVYGSSGPGTSFLGRPWRPYARVVWQKSKFSDVVNPKGWSAWDATSSVDNVYFAEYNNIGPGAATDERVAFSRDLKQAVNITEVLGKEYLSDWYVDKWFL